MDLLNHLFKENSKLKGDGYRPLTYGAESLYPKGREKTFVRDLVQFLYEILYDDTTVGSKGQEKDRVEDIKPYLLRTKRTTIQKPHLDSQMGDMTELGSSSPQNPNLSGAKRRSKRPKKVVKSYNEDKEDRTAQQKDQTDPKEEEKDRKTISYLPWSIDLPLVNDSFFLNLWLIDHQAAGKYRTREQTTKKKENIWEKGKPIDNWQVGIRIEVPPRCIFLWRNDLVHSGCYAGRDVHKPVSHDFSSVHADKILPEQEEELKNQEKEKEPKEDEEKKIAVSHCERMHAFLPTSQAWIADLEARQPPTYGTLLAFTPFDGTLATLKKKTKELEEHKISNKVPVMADYPFWPHGWSCGQEPLSTKALLENKNMMIPNLARRGK